MSERELIQLLIQWRSVAQMLERDEFKKLAGDEKGVIAALLLILLELQKR
ncbi:MAG: hypothetical protein K9W45_07665 [Candidatus Heimdallarchaeum aukensis]|nr:MAG: hypothetical protein K9W45_07665 [Candidatus Heimdallarchaeum aukensis]